MERLRRGNLEAIDTLAARSAEALRSVQEELSASLEKKVELIEKLVKEKVIMTTKLEELASEKREMERKLGAKQERNEEIFKKELLREKEVIQSSEKASRAKWEQKRITEIKEQTIKSLEPEIESILAAHRQEKKLIEMKHSEEIEKQRVQMTSKFQEEIRGVRETACHELSEAVEKERRNFTRQESERFDLHIVELERERRKRVDELNAVRNENERMCAQMNASHEDEVRRLKDENEKYLLQVLREEKGKLDSRVLEQVGRFRSEIEAGFDAERLRMRKEIMDGKEREIDDIIDKLAQENIVMVQAARTEERRNNEAYIEEKETEIDQLRGELLLMKKEVQNAAESDKSEKENCAYLRAEMKLKDEENFNVSQKFMKLQSEMETLNFEKQNLIQQLKIANNSLESFKESELSKIELRVQSLVDGRDQEIDKLSQKNAYLEAKNSALSEALGKARSHYN
jgi:5-azacytidine-induced protein 1